MSRFVVGNLFLLTSMLCAAASHVLLKSLLDETRIESWTPSALAALLDARTIVRGGLVGVLLVLGFVLWILCLRRLDLSYAYPIACSSLLLVVLFSVLFLGESFTAKMWLGTVLILLGVILLSPGL